MRYEALSFKDLNMSNHVLKLCTVIVKHFMYDYYLEWNELRDRIRFLDEH
jgi:hypothetical protein